MAAAAHSECNNLKNGIKAEHIDILTHSGHAEDTNTNIILIDLQPLQRLGQKKTAFAGKNDRK
jgi:hypothetical protein